MRVTKSLSLAAARGTFADIDGQVIKNGWADLGRSRLGEAQKATAPAKFPSRMLSEIESRLQPRLPGFGMMWLNELKS